MTPGRKKLLLGFGSLVIFVTAFLVFEHFRGAWALKRWKARVAAQGEELNIDKLAPVPLRVDENGMPQLLWVAGQLGPFPSELQPPASRAPVPGKWVVITRVNEWPLRNPRRPKVTWVEVAENVAASEQRIEAALEAVENTAFNANIYYKAGFNAIPFTHLSRIRSLAQFFSVAVLHDLHQGQIDAAFRNLKGLLAVPNILEDEPVVLSQMVRAATMQIAFATTWQALQHDGWSDARLASMQDGWSAYDFLPSADKALSMERAIACFEYERFRSSDRPLGEIFGGGAAPVPTPSLSSWDWVGHMFDPRERILAPLWKFTWSHHDELRFCRTVQTALELHREGVASNSGAGAIKRMAQVDAPTLGMYDRLCFMVGRMILGSTTHFMRRVWTAQTTAEIARTAIAIKRYELREGRLPDSLAALVPDFLPRLPIDYMDGKPLRYCVEADRLFSLYSVGVDGQDDGGDASVTSDNLVLDIVWPQPASDFEEVLWRTSRK